MKRTAPVLLASALALVTALSLAAAPAGAQETPRMGGVLKAAMIGEPPSLDLHWTTAVITQQISWHVFETLYTYDRNFAPDPVAGRGPHRERRRPPLHDHPAQGRAVPQRQGDDRGRRGAVAAPLGQDRDPGQAALEERRGGRGQGSLHGVIHLKEPSGSLLFGLGGPTTARPSIPRKSSTPPARRRSRTSSAPAPTASSSTSPTATSSSRASRTTRARTEAPDGLRRQADGAYADEILFIPVPDVAVRLAGVETGEYHFAQQIKPDQYDRIKGLAAVEPRIVKPYGWITAVPNHKEGLMTNKKLRQAFQAALDMEPIMGAAIGNKDFYRLDGAVFFPEQPLLHSPGGARRLQPEEHRTRRAVSSRRPATRASPCAGSRPRSTSGCTRPRWSPSSSSRRSASRSTCRCSTGPRSSSAATSPSCSTCSPPASPSPPIPRSPPRCSAAGRAGGARRRRSGCSPDLARETDPKKRKALIERIQADLLRGRRADQVRRLLHLLDVTRKELRGFRTRPRAPPLERVAG